MMTATNIHYEPAASTASVPAARAMLLVATQVRTDRQHRP